MYPNTILRGKYTIIQELGRGGMGQVFLGQDASGRDIAIKRLAPELTGDAAVLERFRREGEALKADSITSSPNISVGEHCWIGSVTVPCRWKKCVGLRWISAMHWYGRIS
jgi:serine/threonine protein kinase